MHRKTGVTGNLVQTFAGRNGICDSIFVIENFVAFQFGIDTGRRAQTTKSIVEYLIVLQSGRRIVCYFNASCQSIEDLIAPQNRMRLSRYEHSGLGISKDDVLFQKTLASVKDAYTTVTSIIDFVTRKRWIRIGLNPNAGHRVVEYFVLFQYACISREGEK